MRSQRLETAGRALGIVVLLPAALAGMPGSAQVPAGVVQFDHSSDTIEIAGQRERDLAGR